MDVPNARRIARAIADGIVAGEPRPGDMLPSERALAVQYGVSRPLDPRGAPLGRGARASSRRGPAAARSCARRPRQAMHRGVGVAILRRGVDRAPAVRGAHHARVRGRQPGRDARDAGGHRRASRRRWSASSGASRSSTSRTTWSSTWGSPTAAHNPVIEMMLEAIAPQTVALMVRSVGDPQVMVRSQPYHRVALEAIGRRDPAAAAGRDPRPPQRRERALRRRLRPQRRGAGGHRAAEARDADLPRRRRRGGPAFARGGLARRGARRSHGPRTA